MEVATAVVMEVAMNDRRDGVLDEHPEELIDEAIAGRLAPEDRATLERHLEKCAPCEVLLGSLRAFSASVAGRPADAALDREAVDVVMGCMVEQLPFGLHLEGITAKDVLGFDFDSATTPEDELRDRAAVDRVMARLERLPALPPPFRSSRWPKVAVAAVAAAAAIVLVVALPRLRTNVVPAPVPPPVATGPASAVAPTVLADGSEIAPDDATTTIHVGEQSASRTMVHLPSGGARFKVRHDSRRLFRVRAGAVEIEDLGTVFRVAHEPGGRIRVAVSDGRVAVLVASRQLRVELGAGEERLFSSLGEVSAAAATTVETPPAAVVGSGARAAVRSRSPDDAAGLLLAADKARRAGDPRSAVAPLRRLVGLHPRDPRAPSAAFTLGWVLLTELNRPREAALAFADAERIAPRGALAEDAAARVAEAWDKAGDGRRAAEAARRYEQVYPSGRYLALMRGLSGGN